MKAPSEKHLEDYLWAHPEALGTMEYPPQYADKPLYQFHFRQFPLPSGRVDLIGSDYQLVIFELKKGVLTAQSLTQLLRYMRDINWIMHVAVDDKSDDEALRYYRQLIWTGSKFDVSDLVRGVLIGTDIEDENLLIACQSCNIDVIGYSFDKGTYSFRDLSLPQIPDEPLYRSWLKLAAGPLGWLAKSRILEAAQSIYRQRYPIVRQAEDYVNQLDRDRDGR